MDYFNPARFRLRELQVRSVERRIDELHAEPRELYVVVEQRPRALLIFDVGAEYERAGANRRVQHDLVGAVGKVDGPVARAKIAEHEPVGRGTPGQRIRARAAFDAIGERVA